MPCGFSRRSHPNIYLVCARAEINQLSDTVGWWLQHPQELTAKASVVQQWALNNVLTDHFFEQVTELYVGVLRNATEF